MQKFYFIFFAFLFSSFNAYSQEIDCLDGRYKNLIFDDYEVLNEIVYARKQRSDGKWQNLAYDVYLPKGDTVSNRPAIMLAHGGGYIDFINQKSPDIVRIAQDLVKRGYVVISVEYREEPSPFSLLSEENMVKAVGRALIDIRDATCSIMDTTIKYNPYGADPDKVIIGGVSAGAVSFIQAVFLDSVAWLPPQYRDWILEVEPNTQALLDNKYCGANVLGLINISGAILDTSWIKAYKKDEYPAMLHFHGTRDGIVPYNVNRPFGLSNLPKLMGSYPINIKANELGMDSYLDTWGGYGHVPFLGFNLQALFSNNPIDIIFDQMVLDSTLSKIERFCYRLIDCNDIVSGLGYNVVGETSIAPNPNNGSFKVDIPLEFVGKNARMEIFDIMGKRVLPSKFINTLTSSIRFNEYLSPGMYKMLFSIEGGGESSNVLVGNLIVNY